MPFVAKSAFEKATGKTRFGDTVAYYGEGDPNQKPEVALVREVCPTGLVLCVFTSSGPKQRDYVRHVEDPWFKEQDGREKVMREKGTWDTIENAHARQDEQAKARAEAVLRRQQAEEANRAQIIDEEPLLEELAMAAEEMARKGVALPDMVKKLGGKVTVGQLKNHFDLNPVSA